MMCLLSKQADNLWIVFSPNERIKLGDTLKIDDVVAQVVEVQFADIPGVLQHILRKSLIPLENTTEEIQPEVQSIVGSLADQKVALAKIRGRIVEIDSGGNKTKTFKTGISEFNLSRAKSKIEVMDENELFQLLDMNPDQQSNFAQTLSASAKPYTLPLDRLGITVVTGMKGSGKSYAAKKILLDLIKHRVLTIVFDVNGEYLNLWKKDLNQPNEFMPYIKVTLVGAGKAEGAMDASNLLKPALARGELHCVGATTLDEYRKHVEKDAALARRFQPVFVSQPTVEDTISILRGLKEKYEVHHGVHITDPAIIAAATLSDRYIADRFLPDKAIDLIDEAASRQRMQVDSKPEELDELDRRIMQLKIEQEALKKETDAASKDRLKKLGAELAELQERSSSLTVRWRAEKDKIGLAQKLKEELDAARNALAQAQRKGDFAEAGKLAYGTIPELEKKLAESEKQGEGALVDEAVSANHVAQVVSRWTGVPVDKMLEGEREKLLKMEEEIMRRVVGQKEAVTAVSTAVRRARAGLQDPNRPIGSFMFLGPTGVGKTELTKALAAFLFDDESAMVRIDMSEYMEKHSVARLIGAPPGYVGYEEGGALTEAVRRRPYQVVLFDEIEKAHPDVFNVLLQVLDDGRLTDGQGRTVDFRNVLIVMTSNLGSEFLVNLDEGEEAKAVEKEVMAVVRAHFRPEFLNRVDEIILFHRLRREDMGAIVDIQFRRLQRLLDDRKITLALDAKGRQWLADKGYDRHYGARPLKRVIQKWVQDPLAQQLLAGKIADGSTVRISAAQGRLTIDGKPVGGEEAEAAPAKPTIVPFPKS